MDDIRKEIVSAQNEFRNKISMLKEKGGLTKQRYGRFLTCQYHLTQGVQNHFYRIAANSEMAKRPKFRDWLVKFGKEEEFHFKVAEKDLQALDMVPGECPIDVKLWWLYFDSVVDERPFVRLGGTCILENISDKSADLLDEMIATSEFMTKENTRFLTIHRHGPNLAHGEEIIEALTQAKLTEQDSKDLIDGCRYAKTFYLRFLHWMVTGQLLS